MTNQLKHRVGRSGGFRRRGSLGKDWKVWKLVVRDVEVEVVSRAGFGYTAFALRSPRRGGLCWPIGGKYSEMRNMKKKKKPMESPQGKHVAALESVLFAQHHSIVAHCAVTRYDDDDPRQPGFVTIKTFGAVWQIEAKDPDTCQYLRVQQPSLDDALTMLALLLDSEDAPWERDVWAEQQRAKKAPKKK